MSIYSDLEQAIAALETGEKNTAAEMRQILRMMLKGISLEGDIRPIYVTAEYIAENFESNGLGKNERLGWARCNGLNGTVDMSGAIGIGYGDGYTEVGSRIGNNEKKISIPVTGYTSGADTGGGASGIILVSSGQNENGEFLESVKKANPSALPTVKISVVQTSVILYFIQRIEL